jgi:hypothetical protein
MSLSMPVERSFLSLSTGCDRFRQGDKGRKKKSEGSFVDLRKRGYAERFFTRRARRAGRSVAVSPSGGLDH